jgi:hypothetical protein
MGHRRHGFDVEDVVLGVGDRFTEERRYTPNPPRKKLEAYGACKSDPLFYLP